MTEEITEANHRTPKLNHRTSGANQIILTVCKHKFVLIAHKTAYLCNNSTHHATRRTASQDASFDSLLLFYQDNTPRRLAVMQHTCGVFSFYALSNPLCDEKV